MGRRQAPRNRAPAQDQGAARLRDRDRGETLKLYVDTSALVKVYVEEDGSPAVRQAFDGARVLATSVIAYVEARAAFARKRQDGGLIPEDYRRVVRSLDDDWHQYVRLGVGEPLLREAAGLSEVHRLRAYDAIHLASAKLMRDRVADDVVFASWDSELEAAARREGFNLLRARRR